MSMQLERTAPLYERAYQALRTAILEGKISPGERLVETRLAEMLATSRTPIRESIRQLDRDGLVTVTPHDGAYVRRLDSQDLRNLYQCRSALERLAASLAAQHAEPRDLDLMTEALAGAEQCIAGGNSMGFLEATSRFHRLIDLATRNERLDELIERSRAPLLLYRAFLVRQGSHAHEGIHAEHLGLLAVIKSHDPVMADRVMEQHMKSDLSRILAALESEGV
jgi:DNA-binding GntR family transcriptional regulator